VCVFCAVDFLVCVCMVVSGRGDSGLWLCPADPFLANDSAGVLACLDGYMNVAMEQTEEFEQGVLTAKHGDAFIRGNNGAPLFVGGQFSFLPSSLSPFVFASPVCFVYSSVFGL
jgi:LSM domain